MIVHNNIDITDARYNTNAPFKHECKLDTGYGALPSFLILAIRIGNIDQACTARISRMSLLDMGTGRIGKLQIVFENTVTGRMMGIATIGHGEVLAASTYEMYPITDGANLYKGHIALVKGGSAFLKSIAMRGPIVPEKDDFILLDECIYAQHAPGVRTVSINGNPIQPGTVIRIEAPLVVSDGEFIYLGDYKGERESEQKNGITSVSFFVESVENDPDNPGETITVLAPMPVLDEPTAVGGMAKLVDTANGVRDIRAWMGGPQQEGVLDAYSMHITIDSFRASNARVATDGNTIVIKGVLP
jgi:hypothetical protein